MDARDIPLQDQVCKCGHWYDEHEAPEGEVAYCEGCYQTTEAAGGSNTDQALEALFGFTHEHAFEFDPEQNTPEAIANRGGDPDRWPQHVKNHFAQEE